MVGKGLLPELFHRRLLLLSAGGVLALLPVVARFGQLTLAQGSSHRAKAEAKLVSHRWEPTTRGRILDRKGRVLALDRPSFDIAVEYPVITGQWAYEQAGLAARKEAGPLWRQLSPVQRERLVQQRAAEFIKQLDEAWRQFALRADLTLEELEDRRAEIVSEVSRQASTAVEAQRRALEDEINTGFELTPNLEFESVATAEVAQPIREQRTWHVIVHDVDDEVALRFPFETTSKPAKVRAGNGPAAAGGVEQPFWMPGLHLIDGTGREYPGETMDVLVDRRSFPGPLRSDTPLLFTVRGVMSSIVGWMRRRPLDQDYWWQDRVALGAPPDARQRASDAEIASWSEARRQTGADSDNADPRAYLPGESVGATGLEWAIEQSLRGSRGRVTKDAETGVESKIERAPGRDVMLTLDAALQARVQALMSADAGLTVVQAWQKNRAIATGTELSGACVIIEVDTGDILAMVSSPTFSREQARTTPDTVFAPENNLAINKAFARPYAPGSIVKPLMYCAAVTDGVFDAFKRIDCTGHLYPDQPNTFRCWIYKQFNGLTHSSQLGGPLDVTSAIMASCNIYFFNVGRALGPERIGVWYERFGVGPNAKHPRLGLAPYFPGSAGRLVPSAAASSDEPTVDSSDEDRQEMGIPAEAPMRRTGVTPGKGGLSLSESILMGIGQGPIAWTPLHAADAYATLARGGVRIVPRVRIDQTPVIDDLKLDRRAVDLSLEGLRRAVTEDRGTGHHISLEDGRKENIFNAEGVSIWGKSGTADSGLRARDPQGRPIVDERGNPVSLDHAWFVVLVGPQGGRPKYAVSLLVERGGSGGRISGPLCNQIIHALISEGYLGAAQ
jgi:penicillin-binding protein 2